MIRSFVKRDLAGLYQLDQVCFPPEIAYSQAELRHFLNHPDTSCWIVERWINSQSERLLAGFVIVERVPLEGRQVGHIVTLDVDPVERRRGFGKLLMQTVIEQMKQEEIRSIRLEVARNNAAAQHFYLTLGFEPRGIIPNYYGDQQDAELMQKTL